MIVNGGTTFFKLLSANRRRVLVVAGIVVGIELAKAYGVLSPDEELISLATVGILSSALSIFLIFRVNEAYSRWWEARTLWGGIVNVSRSFARQVTTQLDGEAEGLSDAQRAGWMLELVYRHIAYVNALRLSLRRQDSWDELAPFLAPGELAELRTAINKPARLVETQGRRLAEARRAGLADGFQARMFDASLTEMYALQGGCERIKTTVFPDVIAYFTRGTAWFLAFVIPLAVIDRGSYLNVVDLVVVPTMMMSFLMIEWVGASLKNPFENQPNDTPMTALCRTIEIDLRQQLGETELPPPVEPVDGVLM